MNRICYFFLILIMLTFAAKQILAKDDNNTTNKKQSTFQFLPDEDTVILNSVLSAIGGFSGGGLFLIFMIRRLVTSYDESFSKWENRCAGHNDRQDEKNSKIMCMIKDIHEMAQDLKVEIVKLQANTTDKDSITETITKVDMLESDIDQVRGEVKSIMNHLLNKQPKSNLITNRI